MSDVVEQGGPERPRRGWVVGGAAALVLALVAYGATRDGGPAGQARPSPTPQRTLDPRESDRPGGEPGGPIGDPHSGDWALPRAAGTGLRIAVPGEGLVVLDADTGTRTVSTLPVRQTYPLGAISGGWAVAEEVTCDEFPCAPGRVYAVRNGGVFEVGRGHTAVLAADARSVWLTSFTSRTETPDKNRRRLEQRSLTGRRLRPPVLLRPVEDVFGAVSAGPVLGSYDPRRPVEVLDLATGTRRRIADDGLVAGTGGDHVVWMTSGCRFGGACGLRVTATEGARGTTRLADVPGPPFAAAVDPTGRYVAVSYEYYLRPPEPDAVAAEVYEVATGRPLGLGLRVPPVASGVTWSADGWLVVGRTVTAPAQDPSFAFAVWQEGLPGALSVGPVPGDGLGVFAAR